MNKHEQKLTLVGAGPGDPDLITLKAIKSIEKANVILYDALVNPALLKYAANQAELIFVGKRRGYYAYSQSEINALIVEKADGHGHVVRLKGGDPFVFGRGAEEITYAAAHGIATEIVPGISSALAVPAYRGISMTQRNIAESFWVITGTTKARELSKDVALAAKSKATVVILMGMSKLKEIVGAFNLENKGDTPIAIIQNGTMIDERSVYGRVNNIEELVFKYQMSSPAIIVIGEVVGTSKKEFYGYRPNKNHALAV